MANPPTGTVTFLFTDIEGSTALAQGHPHEWPAMRGAIMQSSAKRPRVTTTTSPGSSVSLNFYGALSTSQ